MPKQAAYYLKEQKKKQDTSAHILGEDYNKDNLVTCREDGTPITANSLDKAFKRLIRDNELPDIRFHDLRHTNATIMLGHNIAPKVVSSMLGHSSIGITLDTYSHVMTSMQQPAIEAIESIFKSEC